MQRWKCSVCEYIYDPESGDSVNDVPPGTPFTELLDSWACPLCGSPRSMFEPV